MTPNTVMLWLKIGSAMTIVFGLAVAAASFTATSATGLFLVDMIFFPLDNAQSLAAPETKLVSAVCGGVMVGWGASFWLIATRLYPQDPNLARTIVFLSIGTWFVVDCTGSVLAGAPLNVLFNTGFLAVFWVPLLLPTKQEAA